MATESQHSDAVSDHISESDSDSDSTVSDSSSATQGFPPGILENRLHPPEGLVISQNRVPAGPAFGSIAVTSCADVHFGNKTYYKGPVTIKQFLYGGQNAVENAAGTQINGAFESDEKDAQCDAANATNGNTTATRDTVPNRGCKGPQLVREIWDKWSLKERRKIMLLGGLAFCALIVLLLSILLLIPADKNRSNLIIPNEDDNINVPIKTDIGESLIHGKPLRLISRLEWVAQPPEQPASVLKTPVPFVIITHTATENCTDQASCTFHVRFIQTFHMESRHWWDIGYNFLVGGDGSAYEGRGWDAEGAHTKGYNDVSIGIAFIGTFNKVKAPIHQIEAAKKLIQQGIKLGKISPEYKLFGHRQFIPSLSPGDELYDEIKTWPHWTNSTT